jgi:hypothetical protein
MVTINCKYDCFGHEHSRAILERDCSSLGAVKIVKALINLGVKVDSTSFVEVDSQFSFGISWRKNNRREGA